MTAQKSNAAIATQLLLKHMHCSTVATSAQFRYRQAMVPQ